jgi:hypothetical protein
LLLFESDQDQILCQQKSQEWLPTKFPEENCSNKFVSIKIKRMKQEN